MNHILFFDLEVEEKSGRIKDIGAIYNTYTFHKTYLTEFELFSQEALFVCGHNILAHDLKFLKDSTLSPAFFDKGFIDTLYLSTLLFPQKPYHRLVKDYKLLSEEINNPLTDAILASEVFTDSVAQFQHLPVQHRDIYFHLLSPSEIFNAFFQAIHYRANYSDEQLIALIKEQFGAKLCINAPFTHLIAKHPIGLAYALAIISTSEADSIIPPWLLHKFPTLSETIHRLRLHPCKDEHCQYCYHSLDPRKALKRFFKYDDFRRFAADEEISIQERVVRSALNNQSLLAIFPTGGGKSLTFQLPALMIGEANRALTVVISPLQSLMKDQVDVLLKRFEVTSAVTINGMLSPLERSEAIERVSSGEAQILYIAPEALRSKVIFDLLLNRSIARFVIDEAHCFSSWGHDFRVDYLYIGEFIGELQQAKKLEAPIPVSCFTATAKPAVVEDICSYFREKLSLKLHIFRSDAKRVNLSYRVEETLTEEVKYLKLQNLLSLNDEPKIVYVARTKMAEILAQRLTRDGFQALAYHGQMESKEKIRCQEAFMNGDIQVIVATTAFGMGVDKDNVSMVIHYTISDSLENYVQEAGRAGRKPDLQASCYVLFDENDLNKHFALLTQNKLNRKEIADLWRGIKRLTEYRTKVSKSALELAKAAGWDTDIRQLETKVTSAIAALEDCGYLKRKQNIYRIFANSFLVKDVNGANEIINRSTLLLGKDKEHAIRMVQRMIKADETRVDYLSETLAISKEDIMRVLGLLRQEGIIGDAKDLTAFVDHSPSSTHFINRFTRYAAIEKRLVALLPIHSGILHLKQINEKLHEDGIKDASIDAIKDILNFWQIRRYIHKERLAKTLHTYLITLKKEANFLHSVIDNRLSLAKAIIDYFSTKLTTFIPDKEDIDTREVLLEFSVLELQKAIEKDLRISPAGFSLSEYEEALLYLNAISALKLEGGFLILYKPLVIERTEKNPKKQYTNEDHEKLDKFYQNKTQQIHIVGEYAKKMITSYQEALQFTDDYFTLDYKAFLKKYFPGRSNEISRPLTPKKFKAIFGSLSTEQLQIIQDNQSKHILVAAGPGSGKTKVLVHKVASLLMLEDIKPDQFLMLTFSRAAALEFKERLYELMGNVAYYMDIHTYHSYCFHLMGRVGTLEKSESVLRECIVQIQEGRIPESKVGGKSVVVIDEFQDINEEEYALLLEITSRSEKIRVLVVGDDDQNIYEFRGSSVKYMQAFARLPETKRYELLKNFRSKHNVVAFANKFASTISNRMKKLDIVANTAENGEIRLYKYFSNNLITPLANAVASQKLSGTTAVLTFTNEQACLVESALRQKGIAARLIMAHEGFSIADLLEIKDFTELLLYKGEENVELIIDEHWIATKQAVITQYHASKTLWLFGAVVDCFERNYPKKRKYAWIEFLKESRFEDFYYPEQQSITVSTMHKVKGKEFDHVFVLLDGFKMKEDAARRLVYVAITRAKQSLSIHTNISHFDHIRVPEMTIEVDHTNYARATEVKPASNP
ncbi:RecQ family ATP-dependent DNA helicase [Rhodocytophaga rosea]|uniref:RecQ family ATP-dependent DNA helicase n=1 Tax=Rhodocytophaga rosea TaxID=2704465 RepID=A0A6C0GDZ4_9BACT|nr:RecQ family ATP-dependent DNA helicase [Rhodocytophaga rosea]QHT66185.1 RecQ family ATP-dependent DNA helicase [Rhodocytophaga rosea]